MSKSLKNILQTLTGFIIGGAFLWFTLKGKEFEPILNSLKNSDLGWILLSAVFLLITLILRALRWKVILNSSNLMPKRTDVISSIILGYFVNSFTPKLGELVRCTSLKRSSNISVSKILGTVVSERIYDILVLGLGVLFFGLYESDKIGFLFNEAGKTIGTAIPGTEILLIGTVLFIFGVLGVYILRNKLIKFRIFEFIFRSLKAMFSTVTMTFRIKKFDHFLGLTILIWIALVAMNYCYIQALPDTDVFDESFKIYFAIVVLFIGGIGWAIPTPGGIGTTHFIILQLFIAYGFSENAGVSFGILSNGLTFICTIFFGLVVLVYHEIRMIKKKKHQVDNKDYI